MSRLNEQIKCIEESILALEELHQEIETNARANFNRESPDLAASLICASLKEALAYLKLAKKNYEMY